MIVGERDIIQLQGSLSSTYIFDADYKPGLQTIFTSALNTMKTVKTTKKYANSTQGITPY